jgi:predicted nucleotidyltransferase
MLTAKYPKKYLLSPMGVFRDFLFVMNYNKVMINENEQLKEVLTKIVQFSHEVFGNQLEEVILFGSYARGDYVDGSDVDVMVVANMDDQVLQSHQMEYSRLGTALAMQYGILLSVVLQDSDTLRRWKNTIPFYRNVMTEGVRFSA